LLGFQSVSKAHVVKHEQQHYLVTEKEVMEVLKGHPFIVSLHATTKVLDPTFETTSSFLI
jgi:hypothetical protein